MVYIDYKWQSNPTVRLVIRKAPLDLKQNHAISNFFLIFYLFKVLKDDTDYFHECDLNI